MRRSHGFTLIEVLTALAISGVLIAGIASLLFGSFRIYQFLENRKSAVLENSLIACEKIRKEIQESPVYPKIDFKGRPESLSFPKMTFVKNSVGSALTAEFKLGQIQNATTGSGFSMKPVEYSFDETQSTLFRKEGDGSSEAVLKQIKSVRFYYFISPIGKNEWQWKDETPESGTEAEISAMRIEIIFDRKSSTYTIPGIERTFRVMRRHPKYFTETAP